MGYNGNLNSTIGGTAITDDNNSDINTTDNVIATTTVGATVNDYDNNTDTTTASTTSIGATWRWEHSYWKLDALYLQPFLNPDVNSSQEDGEHC